MEYFPLEILEIVNLPLASAIVPSMVLPEASFKATVANSTGVPAPASTMVPEILLLPLSSCAHASTPPRITTASTKTLLIIISFALKTLLTVLGSTLSPINPLMVKFLFPRVKAADEDGSVYRLGPQR